MRPTPKMKNRWETLIPVPPGAKTVYYRFKFDYDTTGFGKTNTDSKLSQIYKLQILYRINPPPGSINKGTVRRSGATGRAIAHSRSATVSAAEL